MIIKFEYKKFLISLNTNVTFKKSSPKIFGVKQLFLYSLEILKFCELKAIQKNFQNNDCRKQDFQSTVIIQFPLSSNHTSNEK